MSVTFAIRGQKPDWDDPSTHLNLANANAADLLAWLWLPNDQLYGFIAGGELAARCRRRLWDEPRNHDPELPAHVQPREGVPNADTACGGGQVIYAGRPPGYLRFRTEALLELAERAGAADVAWA